MSPTPNFFFLDAGEKTTVDVLANTEGGLLLLFSNNEAEHSGKHGHHGQSQVVTVEFDD